MRLQHGGSRMRTSQRRRGITLVEVLVGFVVVSLILGIVVMALPRSRESARLAGCRKNLMLIGQALAYYDGDTGHLPTVPAFGHAGAAPLPTMLGQLGLGDLSPLLDPRRKGKGFGPPLATVPDHFVADFTCPSDANMLLRHFKAPVSYRVNTGGSTDGAGGPFAPGSVVSLEDVQKADGQDYTAGFGERLVGSGSGGPSATADYRIIPGPAGNAPCPVDDDSAWRTDAGSTWSGTGWSSTLYNHAIAPNASPSCVARDGRSARIGLSSGHSHLVHVLMLGGSVRAFTPTVDPDVWRRFGTISDPVSQAP